MLNNGNQCGNKRVDGVTRCPLHGANKKLRAQENSSMRLYRLAKHQKRVGEFADHDKIKSLREEIAILRIMLEERWNSCQDEHELLLQSNNLCNLVMKIEKLVTSCDRLDGRLGNLLDKQAVKNLATSLMQILATELQEFSEVNNIETEAVSMLLEKIANKFLEQINPNERT
jgi:hypothetical protein